MSEPWSTLTPSTAPGLSPAEVESLPDGMVVVLLPERDTLMVRREHGWLLWRGGYGWMPWTPSRLEREDDRFNLPKLPRLSFALSTDAVRERRKLGHPGPHVAHGLHGEALARWGEGRS